MANDFDYSERGDAEAAKALEPLGLDDDERAFALEQARNILQPAAMQYKMELCGRSHSTARPNRRLTQEAGTQASAGSAGNGPPRGRSAAGAAATTPGKRRPASAIAVARRTQLRARSPLYRGGFRSVVQRGD